MLRQSRGIVRLVKEKIKGGNVCYQTEHNLYPYFIIWSSDSYLEMILLSPHPSGHLVMSEDISGCHSLEDGPIGI